MGRIVSKIVGLALVVMSCTPDAIDMPASIDTKIFKEDRGGCKDERMVYQKALEKNKDLFLTHTENEILATIGRYDFQVLERKNQKVFVYFLESGPHCEQIQNESDAMTMAIYFNATSLAKEVTFQKGIPSVGFFSK